MCTRVSVLFGQTKVNDVDLGTTSANTHQEIIGLDISMDKTPCVDVLNSANELIGQEQDCFVCKLAIAIVKQIFERGSQKINYHGVIITFSTIPSNKWNAYTST